MSEPSLPRNLLELPEMRAAILDDAAAERFFSELAFETQVLGITVKSSGGGQVVTSLRAARDALLSGGASDVQIRYVHAGVEWWDTLARTSAGFRIVRVRK